LISEGFKPRIPDFSILKDDENITKEILSKDKLLLIIAYDLRSTERKGFSAIKELSDQALKQGYTVVGLTASGDDLKKEITSKYDLNFDFYQSDETVLKTIVRANPGILTLKNATVIQKKHWVDASEIDL
jgi:peroxiredoxin